MTRSILNRSLTLTATGLILAISSSAMAQTKPAQMSLANLPVSAMQNGRVAASGRTDANGGFKFDLPAGAYNLCVQQPGTGGTGGGDQTRTLIELLVVIAIIDKQAPSGTPTRQRIMLTRAQNVPSNGGRAGGQALGVAGARSCASFSAVIPGGSSVPARRLADPPPLHTTGVPPRDIVELRVDPRSPPPSIAGARTVTVIGTLSLER